MSKEIKCKECGFANPYSSKFCNNCGAKLPLSTHIICPNCEAPNTRDRIFCDTCGTRLMPEPTPLAPEETKVNQPPPSQPFSLPTRRPGDTGELDPKAVPDWLRTGDINSIQGGDDEASEDMSTAKEADDLPEWLVHDSDSEPIINAPTTISTEFYQDLLDRTEEAPQPDDLFADEEEADLPDWLSDATDEPAEEVDMRAGLTSWLSDLEDDGEAGETAVSSENAGDVSGGLTDWLHELDDLNSAAEESAAAVSDTPVEPADWLQELGPAQTDLFPSQIDQPEENESDEVPGWMDELGPLQTNLLDPDQMVELSTPSLDLPDDDALIDDEDAGTDVTFTHLFETATGVTEKLPDWLDAASDEDETFFTDSLDTSLEDLEPEPNVVEEPDSDWFTADQLVAETDLAWLEETGDLESLADEAALDESSAQPEVDDAFAFDDFELSDDTALPLEDSVVEATDDDFDWLADMEAIQTGELVVEPEPEEEPAETAVPTPPPAAPEPESTEPEPEEDSWDSDTLFADTAAGGELPDWLEQLDESEDETRSESLDADSKELPEWIASLRPGQGYVGSELPDVFSEADLRDTLEGIPEELAGGELPDWLHDTPLDTSAASLATDAAESMEIPDWLQPGKDEEATDAPQPSTGELKPPEPGSDRTEWRSLLEELPPLTPLAESLPKAEIPEWVQELMPPELTGEPLRDPEGQEETAGPLKGMQGVVAIEPVIAKPRSAILPMSYLTTPEQQQQVALLQQLTHETPETVTTLVEKPLYKTAVWLRLSLTILLVLALLAGLFGPSLVATPSEIPVSVQAVNTAVSAAAGQPVLLAIEYTPAMAGELSPQTELLLAQLADNGSPVLITSQYAAGTAVAHSLTIEKENDVHFIGYVPGEGIGLRQLGDCLAGRNACEQLNGRALDADLQMALSQTELVIVLTSDRDNLVNWVEQVGAVATNVSVVAGVTQALAPLAYSYITTEQLRGLLGGTPDAAAYEQLINLPDGPMQTQLNAQIYGQLVSGLLLLIGLVVFGVKGVRHNRRQKG